MTQGFVIDRPDGTRRAVSGYRYAAPRPDAKRYASAASHVQKLPPKVDLRSFMTDVEDQGALSSCVANAVAGAYEYLVKRHRGDDAYDVSRLFIYYNARDQDGSADEDSGALIASAIDSLREKGACSEETWPYDPDTVNEAPDDGAYEEASQFLVEDMQLVPTTLAAWKGALAEGYPIIFGISLFESFDAHRKRGVVPMPSPSEASRESHGGHAMLCVGYSDPDRVFIVRNSWGASWGDKGYCYIPYDYLMSAKFNDGDSWIIRQLENLEVDDGTWGDEESLVGDMDTELSKMSEEDYHAMLEAMGKMPFETRIALVFLWASAADGEVSDPEIVEIAGYMQKLLESLGSPYDAEKVLRNAAQKLENEAVVERSIALLGEHLPTTMLASILSSLREVIGVDDLSEEEEAVFARLVEAWQIEEGGDEESEEEDEEGGDEEDEEGGDEEDEEDSDEEDEEGDEEDE